MKFFKNTSSNEYYFEGKDQKRQLNLINCKSGSEYFLPGYYIDERDKVERDFKPVQLSEVLKNIPDPYFNLETL